MKIKHIFTILFLQLSLMSFAKENPQNYKDIKADFFIKSNVKCHHSCSFNALNSQKNSINCNLNLGIPVNTYVNQLKYGFMANHISNAQSEKQPNFAHNEKQGYSKYSTPITGYESVPVKSKVENVATNSLSITPKTIQSYEIPQFEHSSKDFSKHEGSYSKTGSWNGNREQRTTQNGQQTVSFKSQSQYHSNAQFIGGGVEDCEGRIKIPQLRKAGLSYKTPFEIVP